MVIKAKLKVTRHTKGTVFTEAIDFETGELLNRDDGRVTIPSLYIPKFIFEEAKQAIPAVGETCTLTVMF